MNSKGILFIGNFISGNGSHSISLDLSLRLAKASYQVTTASSFQNPVLRLLDMVYTVYSKRSMYQVAQVDVFSGRAFFWAEVVLSALSSIKKPIILTLRGGNIPGLAKSQSVRVKNLLDSASCVTTPSKYIQKELSIFNPHIHYLPNGIDIDCYIPRKRKNVSPSMIWLRAFHEIYNPCLVVETINSLVNDFTSVRVVMIGPDKGDGSLEKVRQLANKYNLGEHLNIVGPITKKEVPYWLSKGDIFLNTTNYESFGVSVMEAAATGLCVVTTAVGELPFLWENDKEVLLVPPNNHAVMAEAVRRILLESNLAEKLSLNARKKAEKFDWSNVVPVWEDLYKMII